MAYSPHSGGIEGIIVGKKWIEKLKTVKLIDLKIPSFIDFLFLLKEELDVHHTFDFLIAEIENNHLITLIFGEAKSHKIKDISDFEELLKYTTSPLIQEKISNAIKKVIPKLAINFDEIHYEFILVIQSIYYQNSIESLKSRNLPYILWSVNFPVRNKTQCKIIVYENIIENETFIETAQNAKISLEHKNRNLYEFFRSNFIDYRTIIEFTPALDVTLMLKTVMEEYIENYGTQVINENLEPIVKRIGWGDKYEDSGIIDWLIEKLTENALKLGLIRVKKGENHFKKNTINKFYDILLEYRLKNAIHSQGYGEEIFNLAIQNLAPIRMNRDI